MDRTKASDALDAGSIPVGHIPVICDSGRLIDRPASTSMYLQTGLCNFVLQWYLKGDYDTVKDRNKNDKGTSAFVEWIKDVAELIKDNHKILIAVVAFIVLLVAAILISTRVAKRSRDAVVVIDEEDEDTGESYAMLILR